MMKLKDKCDALELVITEELTVEHAEQHLAVLLRACDKKKSIVIDASKVTSVDIAGLQLIRALQTEVTRFSGRLSKKGEAKTLAKAAHIGGFDFEFLRDDHNAQ